MEQTLTPIWIADAAALAEVCERAAGCARIAVDTEADSLHSYHHKLCLVQLSFDGAHALVDPLALSREEMAPLAVLLGRREVRKVLHGADYDVRVLDRDLGARVAGIEDTQIAAQLLGEPATGLAAMVERELAVPLDKKFQRADWGQRPLPDELLAYAACDTAYLEALRDRLAARLRELGRLDWWAEECRALEAIHWEPPVPDDFAFERVKGSSRLRGVARDRLAALYAWREELASSRDVPPFRLLRSDALLALAERPPATMAELGRVGIMPQVVRRYGASILKLLIEPAEAPSRERRGRPPVDREREARVRELRQARDEMATELAIDPGLLAPRAALEAVTDRLPADEASLSECLGRRWRAAVLASRLLPLVQGWQAGDPGAAAD